MSRREETKWRGTKKRRENWKKREEKKKIGELFKSLIIDPLKDAEKKKEENGEIEAKRGGP